MFEQTFVQPQSRARNPWTLAISLSLQCLLVAILLLIPLLRREALRMPPQPQPRLISTWVNLQPVPVQPANAAAAMASPTTAPRPFLSPAIPAATGTARKIDVPTGESDPTAWSGSLTNAFNFGLPETNVLLPRAAVQQPVVPPVTKQTASGPLSVSSGIEGAKLIYGPRPTYPAIAIATRSQGLVRLAALIATDGSIRNLHVVSGPPLLVHAALDAVRQWRYQPTLLNGTAVEVVTEIDVYFTLAR